jgi:peptidoglycan/LPS O-acetylase OafA/YrhL
MSSASNKLDALTGLRAFAALAVFAQHFMRLMEVKANVGPIGGIAVSFFFVLSGFILVYVYKGKLTSNAIPKFYFTRFARIWPLHIVCLVLLACTTARVLPSSDLPWLRTFTHWSLLQSWYPALNWITCYNGVAWTISTEAFFYLMFPLLLLGTPRQFCVKYAILFPLTFGAMIWMAATIEPVSSTKSIANASLDPNHIVQFFPPFRLLEFVTGMAAGIIFCWRINTTSTTAKSKGSWRITAQATIAEALLLALSAGSFQLLFYCGLFRYLHTFESAGEALTYWFSYSGGMFFHAATIYVFARSAGLLSRFFGSRLMVFLGEISFAFYMIHYELILFIKQEFWIGTNFSIGYFAVLTLLLSIGVSAWLYYFVEVPAKETLLRWYAGKSSPRQPLITVFTRSVRRGAQPRMIYALVLLILVPVVVTKLYKRADRKSFTVQRVLDSASPQFPSVMFNGQAELLAAEMVPRRGQARVNTVWRFTRPGTALISLHFSGTKHQCHRREIVCHHDEVGQPLISNMLIDQSMYGEADTITVSLSFNGKELLPEAQNDAAGMITDSGQYRVFSRDTLQEGLRSSRLPVLLR